MKSMIQLLVNISFLMSLSLILVNCAGEGGLNETSSEAAEALNIQEPEVPYFDQEVEDMMGEESEAPGTFTLATQNQLNNPACSQRLVNALNSLYQARRGYSGFRLSNGSHRSWRKNCQIEINAYRRMNCGTGERTYAYRLCFDLVSTKSPSASDRCTRSLRAMGTWAGSYFPYINRTTDAYRQVRLDKMEYILKTVLRCNQ